MTAAIGLIERLREKNLSKGVYTSIFIGVFSIASFFMAWRDQFERAEQLASVAQKPVQQAPTIQVNVPPPTVVFGEPHNVSKVAPSTVDRPKPRPKSELLDEDARLVVSEIVAAPANAVINTPFFNVAFENQGKPPFIGNAYRASAAIVTKEMSEVEIKKIRLGTSTFEKATLDGLDRDERELYPSQGTRIFFSIPGNVAEPIAEVIKNGVSGVQSGTNLLYLFVTIIYRDKIMPKGTYGVTEECAYFVRDMTWHSCGSRHSRRRASDLLAGRVSVEEP